MGRAAMPNVRLVEASARTHTRGPADDTRLLKNMGPGRLQAHALLGHVRTQKNAPAAPLLPSARLARSHGRRTLQRIHCLRPSPPPLLPVVALAAAAWAALRRYAA
jgi:hypothetical protein